MKDLLAAVRSVARDEHGENVILSVPRGALEPEQEAESGLSPRRRRYCYSRPAARVTGR